MRPWLDRHYLIGFVGIVGGHFAPFTFSPSVMAILSTAIAPTLTKQKRASIMMVFRLDV